MDVYKYLIFPQQQLNNLRMEYWLKYNVFTFKWWILIFFMFVPWLIWWRLLDKRRSKDICLFGVFAIIFIILLDYAGTSLTFWVYPYLLTPISLKLEPYDMSILPVYYMLIYQRFSNWKSFIFAQAVLSAVISYIIEPLVVRLDFYRLINWRYTYSFLIYPVIGIICKLLVQSIAKLEEMHIKK